MTAFSLVASTKKRLIVGLGIMLTILCAGLSAWVAASRPPLEFARLTKTVRLNEPRKHGPETVHFDLLAKLLADDRRSAPADEWVRELSDPNATFRVETQSHQLFAHAAPHFTLYDHLGRPWSLRGQLARGPVVLVFYLGYFCNACVHDLFELNADFERFHTLGAEVVVISGDPPELTRQQFEKYGAFGFPVLSDPDHAVAQSYGTFRPAKNPEPEALLHGTFVVGRDEQVHWVSCGDTPFRVNMALLYELARLENKLPQSEPGLRKEKTEIRKQ
jgi:peroxiredoxin Q/BCP